MGRWGIWSPFLFSPLRTFLFSFAFLLGFLGLWSTRCKIQSSWEQQSSWHWAEWLGWLVHHTQYNSVFSCISPPYLNLQLRTGLALLLFLFTSSFFRLYKSTWGFNLFLGHSASSSAKSPSKHWRDREWRKPWFFSIFFLVLCFAGSSPTWMANCLEQL